MYILPKPKKLAETKGEFLAESGLRIVAESEELKITTGWALPVILKNEWMNFAGIEAEITAGAAKKGDVSLRLVNALPAQSYVLSIT